MAELLQKQSRRRSLAALAVLVYSFLYGPLIVLVALSFNRSRLATSWGGFTYAWYGVLARDQAVLQSAWYSLEISAGATLIATLVGTMAALALARPNCPARTPTLGLFYLPIIIPEIVIGCALLTFYSAVKWELSLLTVLAAHVAFSIPYVVVVVRARLAGFDASLEEAAMDLGARPASIFMRVKLPLILPGIVAAALLVFTVSIDDYVITSFVAGTDSTTLPLRIASMVKTGLTPEVNAVSTLLLALTVVLVLIAQRLQSGKRVGE
ncbi:MAG: ABC transporter permease [Planctomycetota bacterium]|nr:ABC transporter permease [Planctomycetota bacterium]